MVECRTLCFVFSDFGKSRKRHSSNQEVVSFFLKTATSETKYDLWLPAERSLIPFRERLHKTLSVSFGQWESFTSYNTKEIYPGFTIKKPFRRHMLRCSSYRNFVKLPAIFCELQRSSCVASCDSVSTAEN